VTPAIKSYSINEAAEVMRVSRRTVERLIESGKIKRTKIGRRTVIRETELERYMDRATCAC